MDGAAWQRGTEPFQPQVIVSRGLFIVKEKRREESGLHALFCRPWPAEQAASYWPVKAGSLVKLNIQFRSALLSVAAIQDQWGEGSMVPTL